MHHEPASTPARHAEPTGEPDVIGQVDHHRDLAGPDTVRPIVSAAWVVCAAVLTRASEAPVREVCHCHPVLALALAPVLVPVLDTDAAAVQRESIAVDLGVQT